MPSFWDYLLAPWKVIGVLLSSPNPAQSASGQAAPGQLCSVQDLGGQLVSVCRVLGYEMPGFVFWASLIITLLFIGASIYLLFQCTKVSRTLLVLSRQLEKLPAPKGQGMTPDELEAIRTLMHRQPLVAPVWDHFEETLLVSTHGEEVFSTQSVESVFSKQALIEDNVHTSFFNAIPGILTGLGLLMTFVAILDGLSHVSVGPNMDVKGIGGLINGLSGKFVSSIVAVSCAVFFTFVERIAYSKPNEAYRKLVHRISRRLRRKTTEQLLNSIQHQLAHQAVLHKELMQNVSQSTKSLFSQERSSRGG